MNKLVGAGLRMHWFGFAESGGEKMLSDKVTVLVNDIAIAMSGLGYSSYWGKVYKKN